MIVTHEHIDHVKGLNQLKNKIKVYTKLKTAEFLKLEKFIDIENQNDFNLELIKTSHDAIDPFGLIFLVNKKKYVHITDTGYLSKKNLEQIKNADFYLIESNYDDELIITNEKYPYIIKKRIMSEKGHLSNENANNYLRKSIGDNTKKIAFAHLSSENNNHENILMLNQEIDVEKIILEKNETVVIDFEN